MIYTVLCNFLRCSLMPLLAKSFSKVPSSPVLRYPKGIQALKFKALDPTTATIPV